MYVPRAFAETDLGALDGLFAHDAFVTLVTLDEGAPFASHLPVLYRRDGGRIAISGHWARPNPQAGHRNGTALMIVHGPHAYVSPSWYPGEERRSRVPTWNYAVAHLYGSVSLVQDPDELAALVAALGAKYEALSGGDWAYAPERESHHSLLRGITGFRFVPERVEMKFKLGQNHPAATVEAAAAVLARRPGDGAQAVAALMRDRLARRPS